MMYSYPKMSKKLLEQINLLEITLGRVEARQKLCRAIGKSDQTLLRWLREGFPEAHDAYSLALACGLNEQDALAVARECVPDVAKAS